MKSFTYTIILALSIFYGCNSGQSIDDRPNIVLIVADDLGWRDLHGYGNDVVETPHLDKLADEGVKFTNAYASCTVCSPTRASLLTGKNPVTVGITDYIKGKQHARGPKPTERFLVPEFNFHLPLKEKTLAEKLKEIGYTTASVGKWHLGGDGYLPTDQGFDINFAGGENGMPPSYYYPYTSEKFKFQMHNMELGDDSLYLTDKLTKEAIQFINENKEDPFFLYVPYYTVHVPWEGRPDLVRKYEEKLAASNDSLVWNPHFLAMIECMDENVGQIINTIEDHQLRENTLVIFVSDNGGLYSRSGNQIHGSYNYPLRGGKGLLYEGGLRVPTIINWPSKIPGSQISEELVISTDIFTTIVDVVNQDLDNPVEGVSLWSHLTDNTPVDNETFYWHYPHYHRTNPGSVIRDGDYKLIHFYEDDHVELYNLTEDIGEQNDLSETMPDKTQALYNKLHQWLEENDAKMPKPNPDYDPSL